MNNKYNVFAKKKPDENNNSDKKILSKDEILSSIPENTLDYEDKNLSLTKIETRWRIFQIPEFENEVIEISYKIPNQERLYMSQNGKWINYTLSAIYDKYVIKSYYLYE